MYFGIISSISPSYAALANVLKLAQLLHSPDYIRINNTPYIQSKILVIYGTDYLSLCESSSQL